MKLYEINNELERLVESGFSERCVDPETGEIDWGKAAAELDGLAIERNVKLENLACLIKDIRAGAAALKAEAANLEERRKVQENKAERLAEYLKDSLLRFGDTHFESPRCELSFRKSTAVEITNASLLPVDYVKQVVEYRPEKSKIAKAIKDGKTVPGAELRENMNLQVR